MSDRPRAGDPAPDDERLAGALHPPPGERQGGARHHRDLASDGSRGHARGLFDRAEDRAARGLRGALTGGDTSPGATAGQDEDDPLGAARPARSMKTPPATPSRPIRRNHPYSPRTEAGDEPGVQRGALDESLLACARCEETGRTCNACVQRRHRAWRLVDGDGRTVEEAAGVMRLPVARVRMLLEQERDRLELAQYRINSIPTARARAFLERELERDPSLTRAEVAHRMNMHQADFDRQFGYAKSKNANAARQERVGIPLASRLTLALGRAPHELEGC